METNSTWNLVSERQALILTKYWNLAQVNRGVDIPVFHMMTLLKVLGILPPEMLNGKE